MSIRTGYDQTGVGNGDGLTQTGVIDKARSNTLERACRRRLPDLGAKQAEAHLDEAVTQVAEDNIVTAGRYHGVKGQRPDCTREGMGESVAGARPRARERR
jgi:hypothetical protein